MIPLLLPLMQRELTLMPLVLLLVVFGDIGFTAGRFTTRTGFRAPRATMLPRRPSICIACERLGVPGVPASGAFDNGRMPSARARLEPWLVVARVLLVEATAHAWEEQDSEPMLPPIPSARARLGPHEPILGAGRMANVRARLVSAAIPEVCVKGFDFTAGAESMDSASMRLGLAVLLVLISGFCNKSFFWMTLLLRCSPIDADAELELTLKARPSRGPSLLLALGMGLVDDFSSVEASLLLGKMLAMLSRGMLLLCNELTLLL